MKKIIFIITLFSTVVVKSQKVSLYEAIKVAEIIAKNNSKSTDINKNNIIVFTEKKATNKGKDTLLYVCKLTNKGFIIIAADKNIPPVLGYCKNGIFNLDSLPPGLIYLLNKYQYETKQIQKTKFSNNTNKKDWELYIKKGIRPIKNSKGAVSPILSTIWGQQNGYNQFVPGKSPAGCTAVAMAQILRYWACRIEPKGELNGVNFANTTYQWAKMENDKPNIYNALLIYHAGVSCKTSYSSKSKGGGGSSSTPRKARDGFVNYWGMKSDADVKWRIWNLRKWKNMLKSELNKGRPLLYSGGGLNPKSKSVGASGHSWVIDGYNSDEQFYCNWGWYGQENGYYSLGGFNPGDDTFNQLESAILYVEPNREVGLLDRPLLSDTTFKYSNLGYYTIIIPEVANASSYHWNTDYGTIIGNGRTVKLYTQKLASKHIAVVVIFIQMKFRLQLI